MPSPLQGRSAQRLAKTLVFITCLMPAALLMAGLTGLGGASLGADPVEHLEHSCGKTALNLLLLTLAITPFRHLLHEPQLLRLRRMLGLFAFAYAVLHLAVYVTLDLELNWAQLGADIAKRPYLTMGLAALLLLVPLAVTSTNGWMRRLGRRWVVLHRLIYPAALIAVWHFWWQVKRDIREPLIYAGILALLLGFRLVRQLRRSGGLVTSSSGSATAPGRT